MAYNLKAPSRINILGNPSDANEGDFATISAAIDIFAYGKISKCENIVLEQKTRTTNGFETCHLTEHHIDQIPLPYNGRLVLIKGAINRLYFHSPEFRQKIKSHGFQFSTWTDVPR